jgi:cytochrome c-type biogenesis protein CcmH/NrfG
MRAIQEKHRGKDPSSHVDSKRNQWTVPPNEPPYVAVTGVLDAASAASKKREGDEAFVKGDDAAALAAYDASLRLDDSNAKTFANKAAAILRMVGGKSAGDLKTKTSDLETAWRAARSARHLDPTYVKAWYREGVALTELGDFESAALAFFEGMQIDGDNADLKRGFDEAIRRGRQASQAKA